MTVPPPVSPHVQAGQRALAQGDDAEALVYFTEALEGGSGDPAAVLGKIFALLRLGRVPEALEDVQASLLTGERSPILHLARTAASSGRTAMALDLLNLVGQVRPDIMEKLGRDRGFASLHDDPRFQQMVGGL